MGSKGAFFIWKCMTNEGKFDVNERKDVLGKWKKIGVCFLSKFSLGGFVLGQVCVVYHTSESLTVTKEKMYWKKWKEKKWGGFSE